jgi:hypothetical protein
VGPLVEYLLSKCEALSSNQYHQKNGIFFCIAKLTLQVGFKTALSLHLHGFSLLSTFTPSQAFYLALSHAGAAFPLP